MSFLIVLFLFWPISAAATTQEIIPGLVVVGWERLSLDHQATLRHILHSTPRAWYPNLRLITVDGAAIPPALATETCEHFETYGGPCKINIFSGGEWLEDGFPPDAPDRAVTSGFTTVVIHELAHQWDVALWFDRWGALGPWKDRLIAEAGCEPIHYLRSMLPRCYFRDAPQELVASMANQWWICSRCVLALALKRWGDGIVHPLNQAIFLVAASGLRTPNIDDKKQAVGIAHDTTPPDSIPRAEIWTISPWRCETENTISGPGFRLVIQTDAQCRVTAVKERVGL